MQQDITIFLLQGAVQVITIFLEGAQQVEVGLGLSRPQQVRKSPRMGNARGRQASRESRATTGRTRGEQGQGGGEGVEARTPGNVSFSGPWT